MRYPKNAASTAALNRLERFLILGSEAGVYRVAKLPLTVDTAVAARECLQHDGLRVVETLVAMASEGRTAGNDPALLVLALATSPKFSDSKTNCAALEALPQVARSGADLLVFSGFVEQVRGWGRGLRSAVARWYLDKPVAELAYHMMRNSHRDLLRLAHPKAQTPAHNALFQWAVEGEIGHLATPQILNGELRQVYAFENARKAQNEHEIVRLIEECRMTHDMIPARWKRSAAVWEALLDTMSYQDLVQNLGELAAAGVLKPQSAATALVVARIIDRKRVANSRIHPAELLAGLVRYREGSPILNIEKALEEAFYLAFDNIEPTGQRVYVALEATGVASALLAMCLLRTSDVCTLAAFDENLRPVKMRAGDRLETLVEKIGTASKNGNLSLPIEDALNRGLKVEAFVMVTSEPRAHPAALGAYRQTAGIASKLATIAVNGEFASDRPGSWDPDRLHVAGFDATVPAVVENFIRVPRSNA